MRHPKAVLWGVAFALAAVVSAILIFSRSRPASHEMREEQAVEAQPAGVAAGARALRVAPVPIRGRGEAGEAHDVAKFDLANSQAVIIDKASPELQDVPARQWTAVFSPDAKSLAVTAGWHTAARNSPWEPGELLLWDIATKKLRLLRQQDSPIRAVAFSPDGKFMATGDFAGFAKLLDPLSGKLLARFPRHNRIINSLAFAPDSKGLFSSSYDGTIKLWDIATKREAYQFELPKEQINSIAVAPDGTRLAACTRESL